MSVKCTAAYRLCCGQFQGREQARSAQKEVHFKSDGASRTFSKVLLLMFGLKRGDGCPHGSGGSR